MKITCIMCPVGCELNIEKNGDEIIVSGNGCIRGKQYGISEVTSPTRIVTSLIKTTNGIASVKTTKAVPKNKIFDVLNVLKNFKKDKVQYGETIIKNVADIEGVDIIVTRDAIDIN